MQRKVRAILVTLGVVGGAVASALFLWPEPRARHAFLIVLDTLRADRMSVYGYDRETTPFLRQSQAQLLKFTQAKAVAPWTMPSHASIFTGLMPSAHRAQWGRIRLDPEFTTLAEVLRDNRFKTVSVASNPFFGKAFGLTQGFIDHSLVEGPARDKSGKILAGLPSTIEEALKSDQRLFVFLNFMDTHVRYNHYQYGRQFGLVGQPPIRNAKGKWKVSAGECELGPEGIRNHGAAYDAAVRYLDDVVRQIVSLLQEKNILDQTLLILTSDHGEGLGYHPELGHSISVWEEQLAIPLLIRLPKARRGGEIVSSPVSLVGLAPFILDNLGVKRPEILRQAPGLEGSSGIPVSADYRSYFGDTKRATNVEMAELYPGLRQTVRPRHVVYCGHNKLVIDDLGGVGFFNVKEDPHEQRDLSLEGGPFMEACVDQYQEMLSTGRFTSFSETGRHPVRDPDLEQIELEALRSLGYVH